MINWFAEVDPKYKSYVAEAVYLLYLACAKISKELLRQAEKNKILQLKVESDGPRRDKFVDKIVEIISKVSPTGNIRREVDALSEIIACMRTEGETPAENANRFNRSVAKYSNMTCMLTDATSRQFAIVLLSNANLSPDALNSMTYQLTSTEKVGLDVRRIRILFSKEEME